MALIDHVPDEPSLNESDSSELESIDAEELPVCVALVDVTGTNLTRVIHSLTCK